MFRNHMSPDMAYSAQNSTAHRTLSFSTVNILMFTERIAVLKYLATDVALQTFTDQRTPLRTPHPQLLGIYKQTERDWTWYQETNKIVHISSQTKLESNTETYAHHQVFTLCCSRMTPVLKIQFLDKRKPTQAFLCFTEGVSVSNYVCSYQPVHGVPSSQLLYIHNLHVPNLPTR